MWLIHQKTFNRHVDGPGGFQPFCRECDARAKADPKNLAHRLIVTLQKEGTLHLWDIRARARGPGWTVIDLYVDLMERESVSVTGEKTPAWHCEYCGGDLREWATYGHGLDRISSRRKHEPTNVRRCCWPCNREKSNMNAAAFLREIERHVQEHGFGRVPWDDLRERKRVSFPDMTPYLVDDQMPLFGVAP